MKIEAVGRRIFEARKERNITQEELAAMAGIGPSHMGIIERAVKTPNLETFIAIANALNVSADYLLQDVVEMSCDHEVTELNKQLGNLSPEMRRRIYKAIHALIDE
ncbi:MAG: helix-turn-helix transcriptional regulator [Oscillospiraceae bacterium]|nr:helix-turn-helix transcriptional regulator [Oscillospiraceae bacterium]